VLAAGGPTVVLASNSDSGRALWISTDGGRTFNRRFAPGMQTTRGAYVDPGDGAITLITGDGSLQARRSTDGGATFGPATSVQADFPGQDALAVGPRSLFFGETGTSIVVAPLDNLANRRDVPGLGFNPISPPTLVADAADNVVALESNPMTVIMRRLASGQASFDGPKAFVRSDDIPAGVALTERAVAVVGRQGGQVMAAVEVWP
jgi:hypothetical protein